MDKSIVKFPMPESVGPRPWGEETLLVLSSKNYSLKKLFIRQGQKGGLQYHHLKDEAGIILQGTLLMRYDNGNGELIEKTLVEGDTFHIPPGAVHQEEALTDVLILEVSTPHFNDRVRVETDYGLPTSDGLQSTGLDEVIFK